jgi:DNA-binding winged helix-turn-helix (wHTH) protein/tetratricopeptide (TPR) repeat protein
MIMEDISSYRFDEFTLQGAEHRLLKGEKEIYIRPKTLELLLYLVKRSGHVVTKDELLDKIWKGTIVLESSLSQCIKEIRKILGDDPANPRYLKTVHRVGFIFIGDVEKVIPPSQENIDTDNHKLIDNHKNNIPASNKAQPEKQDFIKPLYSNRKIIYALILPAAIILILWIILFNQKVLSFSERNWVLITDFDNRTKEEDLELALQTALEWELSRSVYINVVPKGRTTDVLDLMKLSPETKINEEVGREICLRDGNIQAMLNGSIQEIGGLYDITVKIIDPKNGITFFNFNEQANKKKEILPAIRKIALNVRESLGESLPLISKTELNLEKVTTPSLNSLKYYSKGLVFQNLFKWEKAQLLFELAIKEDSSFAMSYVELGFDYLWLGQLEKSRKSFETASKLIDEVTEREKYFILGSYYAYGLGNFSEAIPYYELLVNSYPDDYWGHENLSQSYRWVGDAVNYKKQKLECFRIRPNYAINHSDLGVFALFSEGDIKKANKQFSIALKLNPDLPMGLVQLSQFFKYWMDDDIINADTELQRFFSTRMNKLFPYFQISARWWIARYYLFTGKVKNAISILNESIALSQKTNNSNLLAWSRLELGLTYLELGYDEKFEEIINKVISESVGMARIEAIGWLAVYEVQIGKSEEANKLRRKLQNENRQMPVDIIHPPLKNDLEKTKKAFQILLEGEIALSEVDTDYAIKQFKKVIELVPNTQFEALTALKPRLRIYALNSLASIYEKQLKLDDALDNYTSIHNNKVLNITQPAVSIIWTESLLAIIKLLERKGETEKADQYKRQYSFIRSDYEIDDIKTKYR